MISFLKLYAVWILIGTAVALWLLSISGLFDVPDGYPYKPATKAATESVSGYVRGTVCPCCGGVSVVLVTFDQSKIQKTDERLSNDTLWIDFECVKKQGKDSI